MYGWITSNQEAMIRIYFDFWHRNDIQQNFVIPFNGCPD